MNNCHNAGNLQEIQCDFCKLSFIFLDGWAWKTSAAFGKCSSFSETNQEIGDMIELWEALVPSQQGQAGIRSPRRWGEGRAAPPGKDGAAHLHVTHSLVKGAA